MKLKWAWCEFGRERTIIWITTKSKYYQFILFHEIRFHKSSYTEKTLPRLINI